MSVAAIAGTKPSPSTEPRAGRQREIGVDGVVYESHDSPLGPLLLAATSAGLVRLALPGEAQDTVLGELAERVSPRVRQASEPALASVRRQLDEYFEGQRQSFDVKLDWRLTKGFRREVLHHTARIPYGETSTYGQLAAAAGSPAAMRAAGTALATNPIPIVVPCHRVLRTGGGLGGYGGGLSMKSWLLALERGA